MYTKRSAALVLTVLLIACSGSERRGDGTASVGGRGLHGDTLTIAVIGKSSSNPVFLAAQNGAEAAARDLSQKHSIHIAVRSLTPSQENADTQAERVREAVNYGADAILISVSDAGKLTGAINDAHGNGVEVMTFDSDAPASRRFAYYGVDDYDLGRQVTAELATLMANKGKIGILAGNANAPNLQARAKGARDEAAKHPGIEVVGTFQHSETPQAASTEVQRGNKAHPDLNGWAMVGGWPLFGTSLLNDLSPTRYKIVAVDALPEELAYVEKGVVPVLLAQPVYQWGYVGVQTIVDKVHFKAVVPQRIPMKVVRVTKENLKPWAQQLKDWGFKDVPAKYLQ
jgi:ribose transport system substrate-binding protein